MEPLRLHFGCRRSQREIASTIVRLSIVSIRPDWLHGCFSLFGTSRAIPRRCSVANFRQAAVDSADRRPNRAPIAFKGTSARNRLTAHVEMRAVRICQLDVPQLLRVVDALVCKSWNHCEIRDKVPEPEQIFRAHLGLVDLRHWWRQGPLRSCGAHARRQQPSTLCEASIGRPVRPCLAREASAG